MKEVSIVGFGRFGKTLLRLLGDDFKIRLYNHRASAFEGFKLPSNVEIVKSTKDIYKSDAIFFAVPISAFESVFKEHKKYFTEKNVLIDVLSVKVHPENVFRKYLTRTKFQAILTHPMFGPDSSREGFKGLPLIIDNFSASKENYDFWKEFFKKRELNVVEMSADQHDRLASKSQGVTHFIGRILEEFGLEETPIDSLGSKKLKEIEDQTCNDTWELFLNLQNYNPYTKQMRVEVGKAFDKVYNKLLPERVEKNNFVFGIQGGVGSFNEEALHIYLKKHNIKSYKVKYLYTSPKVLNNLYKGNIDFGLFAIYNTTGGIVDESITAMAKYNFKIVEEFTMPIAHCLMKRKDSVELKAVMGHPQTLVQCKDNLKKFYPDLEQKTGKGDMVDTAKIAWTLAKGKLSKDVAVLGPKRLAEIYDFEIVKENMQDDPNNRTSFLMASLT